MRRGGLFFIKERRKALLISALYFLSFFLKGISSLSVISGRGAYAGHGAAEADGAAGLLFLHVAPGAGRQPVGAIGPGSSFDHAGFIADKG